VGFEKVDDELKVLPLESFIYPDIGVILLLTGSAYKDYIIYEPYGFTRDKLRMEYVCT